MYNSAKEYGTNMSFVEHIHLFYYFLNVKMIRFARALTFIFVQLIFQSTDLQQHIELSVKSLL